MARANIIKVVLLTSPGFKMQDRVWTAFELAIKLCKEETKKEPF